MKKKLFLAFVVAFSLMYNGAVFASEVYVAVSPGIAQCVEDIYASFVSSGGGELLFVKEPTGPLAQKIDAGAPFALLVAADPDWPEWLEKRGKLRDVHPCANGRMVLWSESKSVCDNAVLAELWIAVPNPETTSHGKLASSLLKDEGIWDKNLASGAIIIVKDALHGVMAVGAGSADAAMIPASLAIESGGFYSHLPSPPLPTVGGLNAVLYDDTAAEFWNYLRSPAAAPIWEKWGFEPVEMAR